MTTETSIIIRDIETAAEMRLVEDLQKEVWGIPELEVVPATHLIAARAAGGVLLGAFDGEILVGFVYGFVSYENGQTAHHSHLLAVKSDYRSFNLGYRLKIAQRERVLAQGIGLMSWTFDPLQSLNANFNFNKLGVVADCYLSDFYGADAASFLHRNGTDRLWVTWLLTSRRVEERLANTVTISEIGEIKPLVEVGNDDAPRLYDLDESLSRGQALIEIPADINALEWQSRSLAARWREATRQAFVQALAAGYIVEDFYRLKRFGAYLLTRGKRFGDFDQ